MDETTTARGINGTITFDGRMVTIKRSGLRARMKLGGSEKRIPIGSITAVQWKKPGIGLRGFIAVSLSGEMATRSKALHQIADASKDENAVIFGPSHLSKFSAMRDRIEAALAGSPGEISEPTARRPPPGSTKQPGWYRDPSGKFDWRWFDGAWSDQVANEGDDETYTHPAPH